MSITAYWLTVIVFDLLMLSEFIYSKIRKSGYYLGRDSWANIAMYWGNITVYLFYIPMVYVIYAWVHGYAIFKIEPSWYIWLLLFLLEDLCFYWFHRANHRIRLLWASHVNHHSSELFNLSTAVRQTFTPFLAFIFWLPLLLLGFQPEMVVLMQALSLLYQSLLHTRYVGKLGIFEYILNTPSHHRVHHGRNQAYLDKNYGGVLIIWDRLFNTFAEEKEEVKFGITERLKSYNPFVIAFHEYRHIVKDVLAARSLKSVLEFIFGPPSQRQSDAPWHKSAWSEKIVNHIGLILTHSFIFFLLVFLSPIWLQYTAAIGFVLLYMIGALILYLILAQISKLWLRTIFAIAIALPIMAFCFVYQQHFAAASITTGFFAAYGFVFLLKAISFARDAGRENEFLHYFYFILFSPSFVFNQAFKIAQPGFIHWLKSFAKLFFANCQIVLAFSLLYFLAGGFSLYYDDLYVPLAWFSYGYESYEFWLILLLKACILYLLLSGFLKFIIAMFNLVGFRFESAFRFSLFAKGSAAFWRRFYTPLFRWYRKYIFVQGRRYLLLKVIAAFALTDLYLIYFLKSLGINAYIEMTTFAVIQAILVYLEMRLRLLMGKSFKPLSYLLIPTNLAFLLVSLFFFFQAWDKLFL